MPRIRPASAALASAALACAAPARADDLRDALLAAYTSNPTLQAARANQRATDETVPIVRAQGLPSLTGAATYTEFLLGGTPLNPLPHRSLDTQANLGVPVYSGGAVRNGLRAAETRVAAGQADLRGVEDQVFTQVVTAYMDVIRDAAIVDLDANNVDVLDVNLRATRDRFEIGDLTRTDVAQSNARLALARGTLRQAEASLIASRERYVQTVGKAPGRLDPPPPLPPLPASADEAVEIALDANPDLNAARERTRAARFDVKAADAGRLPKVSVFTGIDRTSYLGSLSVPGFPSSAIAQHATSSQAGVRATIPLFQGGLPAAQQRQAQAHESAAMETEIGTERTVIATVRSAWSAWRAANDVIALNQTAVDAAKLSLEGVRAENSVGNRTILDILNAEQELVNAEVQLVGARRNAYVAGFNLLAAMGQAEAKTLGLDGGLLYDPTANYRRVRRKVWDWSRDPAPQPHATRTVDTAAQDAKTDGSGRP